LDKDVKPSIIARGTPGFSGADLANLVNEAALLAARGNNKSVKMDQFDKAKDKVMMGTERKSLIMSEKEKKLTAYHEAGHTIVGLNLEEHDPVYKVTIIPRGRALGLTMFLPEEDRYSISRQRLVNQLTSLFGGRAAEELIFGKDSVTTGASNDIERATKIARNMVTKWGLSEKLGPLSYSKDEEEIFLGRSVTQHKQVSDTTVNIIDQEVRQIIDQSYDEASDILKSNVKRLHKMAEALIKYETLDEEQIKDIINDKEPRPPDGWNIDDEPGDDDHPKDSKIGGHATQH